MRSLNSSDDMNACFWRALSIDVDHDGVIEWVDPVVASGSPVVVDADGDGDLDILLETPGGRDGPDRLLWFESEIVGPIPGDIDRDGEVDFADFLALSVSFEEVVDAAWEDGDFNSDGQVGFADFLILSANFGASR